MPFELGSYLLVFIPDPAIQSLHPLSPGVRCVWLFCLDKLKSFRKSLATSESPRARLLTRDGHDETCYWGISVAAAVTRLLGAPVVP